MITLHPSDARGTTSIGWLESRHSFSFGEYQDPRHMNFRALRVINDDIIAAGKGFGTHPHRDMEIITVVLAGALEHRDSLGHGEVLRPGEVQVMTAGRGIRHSEFNPSREEPAHLIQIWIMPEANGLEPAYAQKPFPRVERLNRLQRVAGRDRLDADGALRINQDADVVLAALEPRAKVTHALRSGRGAWVHVATGEATLNGQRLRAGDAAAVESEPTIELVGVGEETEILLFNLA